MNKLDKIQRVQERQYKFPYHHLTDIKEGNFSLSKHLFWGYEYMSCIEFILGKIKKDNFDALLDLGCGDGKFLFECNKIFTDKKLHGLDYSKRSINLARGINPDIKYIEGEINDADLPLEQYDIITLIEVLEHINPTDIDLFLRGIEKRLRDNGTFILTVPSKNIPVTAKHYQHFDLESLEETLKPHFKIKKAYFLNRASLSEKIIRRLFSNHFFILNQRHLLNFFYKLYKSGNLLGSDKNTQRICVFCEKSEDKN